MGAFISLIGIAKLPQQALFEGLAPFEAAKGDFVEVYESPLGHYLIMPGQMMHDAEGLARQVSSQLSTSCCLLRLSDDVVWSYDLFHAGQLVDSYNSMPNYFTKASEVELSRLKGDPTLFCAHWPGVSAQNISGYLTNKELLSQGAESKAYETDKCLEWDAWQLGDFMGKIGLEYPVDENGNLRSEPIKEMNLATEVGLEQKAAFEEALAKIRNSL